MLRLGFAALALVPLKEPSRTFMNIFDWLHSLHTGLSTQQLIVQICIVGGGGGGALQHDPLLPTNGRTGSS